MATKKKVKQTQKQKQTVTQKVVVNVGTAPRKRRGGKKKAPSGSPLGKGLPSIQGGIVASSYNPFEVQQLVQNEVKRLHQAEPTLREIIATPKVPLVQDVPTLARTETGTETMASISAPLMPPLIGGSNVLGQQVSFDNEPALGIKQGPLWRFTSKEEEERYKLTGKGFKTNIEPDINPITGEALLAGEGKKMVIHKSLIKKKEPSTTPPSPPQTAASAEPEEDFITVKKKRGRKPKTDLPSK